MKDRGFDCLVRFVIFLLALPFVAAYVGAQQGKPPEGEEPAGIPPTGGEDDGARFERAIEQVGLLQLPGLAWYWSAIEANQADWDYPMTVSTLGDKFLDGEAVRFDDNDVDINAAHAVTGAAYYLVGRGNGLSIPQSLLIDLAGSAMWEYVIEWHEVSSINDTVMNLAGGPALGEAMFQLGEFFDRSSPTRAHRWLAAGLAAPSVINRWLDDQPRPTSENLDRFGFPADTWYRIQVEAGISSNEGDDDRSWTDVDLRASSELMNLDDWGQAGTSHGWSWSAPLTRLAVGYSGTTDSTEVRLQGRTVFGAYHKRDLEQVEGGGLVGSRWLVGLGSGFDYMQRGSGVGDDSAGIVNVVGSTVRWDALCRRVASTLTVDVGGDFASLSSAAFPVWRHQNDPGIARSILRKRDAYHAFGLTTSASWRLSSRRFELGAAYEYHTYESIDSRDRHPEFGDDHLNPEDEIRRLRGWFGYTFPNDVLSVVVGAERYVRHGRVGDVRRGWADDRIFASARFTYGSDPRPPGRSAAERRAKREVEPAVFDTWTGFSSGDPLRFSSAGLTMADLVPASPGAWRFRLDLDYFNVWYGSWHTGAIHREFGLQGEPLHPWEIRTLEQRHAEDAIYRVDVEGARSVASLARDLGRDVTLTVQVPWVRIGAPRWDLVAKDFHELFGLHAGDRRIFDPGQTVLYIRGEDRSTAAEGWEKLNGSGLGDARVSVSGPIGRALGASHRWGATVELPTGEGNGLHGSGGVDVGLRWLGTWETARSRWRIAAGYTHLAGSGDFLGVERSDTWHLRMDYRRPLGRVTELVVGAAVDSSPLAAFTDSRAADPAPVLEAGLRFKVRSGCRVIFGLTENITMWGLAPDFALHLGVSLGLTGDS